MEPTFTDPSPELLLIWKLSVTEMPRGRAIMPVKVRRMVGLTILDVSIVVETTEIGAESSVVMMGRGPAPPVEDASATGWPL